MAMTPAEKRERAKIRAAERNLQAIERKIEREESVKFCAERGVHGVGGITLYRSFKTPDGGELKTQISIEEFRLIQKEWDEYWDKTKSFYLKIYERNILAKEARHAAEIKEKEQREQLKREAEITALYPEKWSVEKQRRSNVDWVELIGPNLGADQMAWERRSTVCAMRASGMSCVEISKKFGVTPARISQMEWRQKSMLSRSRIAPAESHINDSTFKRAEINKRDWIHI